jgi:hypothetical protein
MIRNPKTFHEPLKPGDTPEKTVGCRHTNPNICSKNMLPNVCAFVRADKMCLYPPRSWKKQYTKLNGSL